MIKNSADKISPNPENNITKRYQVTLKNKVTNDYVEAFAKGMYFEYEDIITQPATLIVLSDYEAEVILTEGKYHQIKRMFGRFRNQVIRLHRSQIGSIFLDENLHVGQWQVFIPSTLNSSHEGP